MKRKAFYGRDDRHCGPHELHGSRSVLLYSPHEKAPQLSLRFEEIHKEMTAIFG